MYGPGTYKAPLDFSLVAQVNIPITFGAAEDSRAFIHLDGSGDDDVPQEHFAGTEMKIAVDTGTPQFSEFFR